MTSAWDRIGTDFRAYLEAAGICAVEFNSYSGVERAGLYDLFHKLRRQQQQDQSTPRSEKRRRSEEEATPGSTAHRSRSAMMHLVETIQNTEFSIEWCRGGGDTSRTTLQERISKSHQESKNIPENCSSLLTERMGISLAGISTDGLKDLDFSKLRTESESLFQKGHLQDKFFNVEKAKALDLSVKTVDGPFFKPATKVDGHFTVAAKSAKLDGTSMVAPMDLEIKSDSVDSNNVAKIDYEVLEQAFERVSMRMHNQEFLKMAFAFAVTGRSAWFLFAQRADPMEKPTVWVDQVRHGDVGSMWMSVTRLAEQRPRFFLAEDGAAICSAMNKIGVTTWCCRVKALARSEAIVYGVTVPKEYTSGGSTLVGVDVAPSSITYAVKIVRDDATFKTESVALQKIATKAGPNSSFYALGCVPATGEATRFCTVSEWETGQRYKPTGRYWWDTSLDMMEREGGAIIMRSGITSARQLYKKKDALPRQVSADLVTSLQRAHSAGILHCDLRRSNFVKFNNSWQVIDYSLSTEVDSDVEYDMGGGAQADCAGIRIRTLHLLECPIQWTKVDDYQMLIANTVSLVDDATLT